MPDLPDDVLRDLVTYSGLTTKDAKTLMTLDDGERLDYFDEVRSLWGDRRASGAAVAATENAGSRDAINGRKPRDMNQPRVTNSSPVFDRIVANW